MSYVIDQVNCSCCHRCRVECPVKAIRFKNDKYWIDPEKCVSCGHCATVCHNGVITDAENPAPAPAPHEKITKSCDVCVIGGGGAGMVAAARAVDSGCKVIVLEKNFEIGGSAWYASGFAMLYSKWHAEAGDADPRENAWKKVMKKTAGEVDGDVLHALLQANGDFADWLIDEHDLGADYKYNPGANGPMSVKATFRYEKQDERIDGAIGPGSGGWFITTKMAKAVEDGGGEIICNARAKKLLTDEQGAVVGVIADDPGGEIEISCKAVIVAAGAFTRNKELMAKFQPLFYTDDENQAPVHIFTHKCCTGDGITMCDELGADIDYEHRRVNMFGPMRHPYPAVTCNLGFGVSFRTDGTPYQMDMSEGMTEVSDLAYDKSRYVWSVTDDAAAEASINAQIAQGVDHNGINMTEFLKTWRDVIAEEAEGGAVVIADTLEELADKLGFEREPFLAEIRRVNEERLSGKGGGGFDLMAMMGGMDNEDLSDMECKPFDGPKPKPKAPAMPFGMPGMPAGVTLPEGFKFPEGFEHPQPGKPFTPPADFEPPEGFPPKPGPDFKLPDNIQMGGMPGGVPGGAPGGMPGGAPGGMPGMPEMPGGAPGGMPGMPEMPGGAPGGMPGMPGAHDDDKGGMPGGGGMGPMIAPKPIAKAPFYALKMKMFHENAVGGMVIDENASVLKNGKPIPGLYAAGDNTRGIMVPGPVGVQLIEGTMTALTVAFTSGYLSGVRAAEYAKSK